MDEYGNPFCFHFGTDSFVGDENAIMNAKMLIPESRIEQNFIVEILSTADHEINLLQESIEAEKQKKKALMQLLLTGKVRVKCNG